MTSCRKAPYRETLQYVIKAKFVDNMIIVTTAKKNGDSSTSLVKKNMPGMGSETRVSVAAMMTVVSQKW